MKFYLLAATAATLIATPAAAQEVNNFEGAKIGVVAGYDSFRISNENGGSSEGGFHYGITGGYDKNLGGAIVGIEGEISDATTKKNVSDTFDAVSLNAGRELYVGARVGAAVTPTVLVYAKAGYVNSKVNVRFDSDTLNIAYRGSEKLDGYRLGAGAEYAPSNVFGRVEYRYSDFGRFEVAGGDTGLKSKRHQLVATLGTRF